MKELDDKRILGLFDLTANCIKEMQDEITKLKSKIDELEKLDEANNEIFAEMHAVLRSVISDGR